MCLEQCVLECLMVCSIHPHPSPSPPSLFPSSLPLPPLSLSPLSVSLPPLSLSPFSVSLPPLSLSLPSHSLSSLSVSSLPSPSPSSLFPFLLKFSTPSSTNVTDVVDPIDYEKFLAENAAMLDTDPHRDLLIFPEDDVSVTSLPRKHRTIEIPVPGPAK